MRKFQNQSGNYENVFEQRAFHKLALIIMLLIVIIGQSLIYGNPPFKADQDNSSSTVLVKAEKRVLIYSGDGLSQKHYGIVSPTPLGKYLSWYMNDPLLLSLAGIHVTEVRPAKKGDIDYVLNHMPVQTVKEGRELLKIDFTKETLSSYDLIIIPFPHYIDKKYFNDLFTYINKGGSLFLVQPGFESEASSSEFLSRLGITYHGWVTETPSSSLITNHESNRILGLPEGKSVYPHRMYLPHLKMDSESSDVLTRLSIGGDPDLLVTSNGKVAIMATDIVSDMQSTDPEYPVNEKNFRYLFINCVRKLLGFDFFNQPVQQPQQKWSELFYAYSASREYMLAAGELKPFSDRLPSDQLKPIIEKADSLVFQAANLLVHGKHDECKSLFDSGVKLLSETMDKMTSVDRFFIRGWHSSVITPYYYGGGLIGYAEVEWQDHLVNWMKKQIDWITRTGSRRLIDVFPHDWEILKQYYQEDINLFKTAIKDGRLEAVNGMYTAAYLPILPEESNIRQFRYGLNGYKDVLDASVKTFICPSDHFDFHPQLPQILNSYGYKNALVNEAGMGTLSPVPADIIFWKGLDGNEIISIPQIKGITDRRNWFNPEPVAEADRLGYRSVVIGIPSFDATFDFLGERESSLINPIAPIAGKWVTTSELFDQAPKPEKSFYLGVDQLWANKVDGWSSWGWMNEATEWNRTTENKILAAEKLSVIAYATGKTPFNSLKSSQTKLDNSWRNLLRTQDHMLYGSVDYTNQIPPSTLKPGEEKRGKHVWGYDFPLLHDSLTTVGGMENYCETRAVNIGSPRIPGSRYNRAKSFIKESQDTADNVITRTFGRLLIGEKVQPFKDKIIPFVVFNQLGWIRNDIIMVEKEFPEGELINFILSDGKSEIPYQVVTRENYKNGSTKKIKFLFKSEVPSMGYNTYFIKPVKKAPSIISEPSLKASNYLLENDYYVVEIDPVHGGVKRIFDKELGVEMLNSKRAGNELFSQVAPSVSSTSSKATVTFSSKGLLSAEATVRSKVGEASYKCKISLYKGIKRIDFDLEVDYGKAGLNFGSFKNRETGLFVRFPLNYTGKLYVNQPFGVYETNKDMQVAVDFADLFQGQYGMALINRNTPSYQYKDGALSICLTRGIPLVTGKQNYQYSIYTHKENIYDGDAYTVAKSVNMPLQVYWPENQVEKQMQSMSFITIDKQNIVLSALYCEGDLTFVRLYERSGKATDVNIDLPYLKTTEFKKIKLNGEEIQKIQNVNGKVKLDFKPWEIITLSFPGVK